MAKAILSTAAATGVLLLVSHEALGWWAWQAFLKSRGPNAAVGILLDPPAPGLAEAVVQYIVELLALCVVGAVFAAAIIWPVTLATRRIFDQPLNSRLTAVGVVSAVSGLGLATQIPPDGPWHPVIVFAIGGSIGIVATTVFCQMLPPNTSLERTREG